MNKFLLAVAVLAVSATANAAPIQWTGAGSNGHWYEYVGISSSWTDARAAAHAANYFDGNSTLNGYLATNPPSAENSFPGTLANDGRTGLTDPANEGRFPGAGRPEAGPPLNSPPVRPGPERAWVSGGPLATFCVARVNLTAAPSLTVLTSLLRL